MPMNKIIIFLSIYLLSLSVVASDFNLVEGKSRSDLPKSLLKTIYRTYSTLPGYLYEYSPNKYYSLSKTGNAIGVFDLANTDDILSGWPLTPWPENAVLASEQSAAAEILHGSGVYSRNHDVDYWGVNEPAEIKVGEKVEWNNPYSVTEYKEVYGCLGTTPLRYGDVDGSGNLLVLTQEDQIRFFSPALGKTIFLINWFNHDEVSSNILSNIKDENYDHRFYLKYKELGEAAPQYVAESSLDRYVDQIYPAWRSFAKLYIADFDGDKNPEILVWRKFYRSNLVSEQAGFKLAAENIIHYEYVNGEYKHSPDIQLSVLKSLLTANNQTWQSGFPSKSECAGQEGQLIPEMHDPLLNDPDVLK
jgi:hypothetical protein